MENIYNSGTISKFRTSFSDSYHRSTPCPRNLRQTRNDYVVPVCSRRSTSAFYQEQLSSKSCTQQKLSKGKICSVVLVMASITVLVVVLSIAGMAFYLGGLHTEHIDNNFLIAFNCSAKLLRGDRFVTGLEEKASKYQLLFETLYKKSILGPCYVSCEVQQFGPDALTILFKLILNKRKIPRNVVNVEKTIRDILVNDAIARKPIFRTVRFDPKNVQAKLDDHYQRVFSKSSDVMKHSLRNSTTIKTTQPTRSIKRQESLIHGSFKISKTEADITEKKTELTTAKPADRITQIPKTIQLTTQKSSFVTNLFKTTQKDHLKQSTISIQASTITILPTNIHKAVETTQSNENIKQKMFDQKPWIPIVPELQTSVTSSAIDKLNRQQPIYTSFTNPGLSFHLLNMETLGSTSLKSHPIPVNKIPGSTEPSKFVNSSLDAKQDEFIEIDTVKYIPGSLVNDDSTTEPTDLLLKNLSSIFHDLASSFKLSNENNKSNNELSKSVTLSENVTNSETLLGKGQVEVVEEEEETLILQTTKLPLITLIPVKSNSGIRSNLRQRPHHNNISNSSVENRSFPGSTYLNDLNINPMKFAETEVVTSVSSEVNQIKIAKPQLTNFKITGSLNFATETNRSPKVGPNTSDYNHSNNFKKLTAEQLAQLSEISKINKNNSTILTKDISPSYTVNHSGLKILTKTFIKSPLKESEPANKNKTECGNFTIRCGDGQCLPELVRCNQLIDCKDGTDEHSCNCADYLKSQYLLRKICDGIVDCWDYSDENQCEWCKPDQHVCGHSKVCIDKKKICDGVQDCLQGDDERQCITITTDLSQVGGFSYSSFGYLLVRKFGVWGKLCVENLETNTSDKTISWKVMDLGKTICKTMTYQNLTYVGIVSDANLDKDEKYFELISSQNYSKNGLSFTESNCKSRQVVQVKCESLECGARPQVIKQARIVGGGNAGLGSWPWQVALYKEGEFQCGASLLSNLWLISAGHCFYHSQEEYWVARLGALRRGTDLPSPYEQLRTIIKIVVHPGYMDSGFVHDISLLKMESPVLFSDYIRPICLPTNDQPTIEGQLCTVIGWGQLFEVGRIFPDTLQEVQVPIISTEECRRRTIFLPLYKITDDMFCAGHERGGRDTCLGDSGGPLMCPQSNGKWTLQGVTSNGYGCARANRPGVYTKVANYITWISKYLNDHNHQNSTKSKNICLGHRCPLGECLPNNRLCNGFIECSDGSDELDC